MRGIHSPKNHIYIRKGTNVAVGVVTRYAGLAGNCQGLVCVCPITVG